MYSVFLVEDEIVTREGIRNSIPWKTTPYTLAGEAPDGEIALPAIRDIKPDILITDIKMPFMDGLALARIIKRDQPWIKIIILSGHDEFEYAKEAISIGVEEYLLKPVSAADMLSSLEKVSREIEKEKRKHTSIETLKQRIKSSEDLIRDKWLCDLVTGQTSAVNALETAGNFGIDLIGAGYMILIIELSTSSDDYTQFSLAREIITAMLKDRRDFLLFPQSMEKLIILARNISEEAMDDIIYTLAQGIKFETERTTQCRVAIAIGSVVDHIEEIIHSYADADKTVRYMMLTGKNNILSTWDMKTVGNPDPQLHSKHHGQIREAKKFIDEHFSRQNISLADTAAHVNISPNHFSTIFSQETGETFIEYLTAVRIQKAQQLLKDTAMKCADIAFEVGYSDSHYFSFIFKKHTGMSPREYRLSEPAGN
ncbi:MAG: response regulator [Spirochaetales bacterium]|nr:response regulator [Spirochaetales bacterium]